MGGHSSQGEEHTAVIDRRIVLPLLKARPTDSAHTLGRTGNHV